MATQEELVRLMAVLTEVTTSERLKWTLVNAGPGGRAYEATMGRFTTTLQDGVALRELPSRRALRSRSAMSDDPGPLRDLIQAIPGDDGWWNESARDTYLELAEQLRISGLETDEIVEILEKAYWAAASCYGG